MKTIHRISTTAVALLGASLLVACTPDASSDKPEGKPTPPVFTSAAPKASETPTPPSQAATPAPSIPAAVQTAQLPNLTGVNHQTAQDALQAAGFFNLREKDASGKGRLLLLDRNWKVCRQEPGPGAHGVEITVTLYSVKQEESC